MTLVEFIKLLVIEDWLLWAKRIRKPESAVIDIEDGDDDTMGREF
jgi:hypothetical protein